MATSSPCWKQPVGDATWQVLSERYGKQELLDLLFTGGQYNLISWVANSCGIELEEGLSGLPQEVVAPPARV